MKKLLLVLGLIVLTANSVFAIDFDNIRKNTAKTVNEQVNLITAINAKQLQDERDFKKSLSSENCRMLAHYLLVADDIKTYNNGGDSYYKAAVNLIQKGQSAGNSNYNYAKKAKVFADEMASVASKNSKLPNVDEFEVKKITVTDETWAVLDKDLKKMIMFLNTY